MSLAVVERAAAQTALDLFPQDAAAGIAIRDLDDLIKKGDKFLTDADIRVPLRPSELFDQGTQFLGVNRGFNRKAPAGIVLLSPEKDSDFDGLRFLNFLVPVLPYTDADTMAENFGIGKGKLTLNNAIRTDRKLDDRLSGYAAFNKSHIYLNDSEKTLKRILKSKPASASFSPEQRKNFDDSDILIHLGEYLWRRNEVILGADAMRQLISGNDPKEKEFAEQFAASLKNVDNAVIGFRLRDGLDTHFLMTVPKDGQAAKLFKSLKHKHPPSTLKGLPDGNVLLAQASSGDTTHQAMITKILFNFMLEELLINQKVVHHVDRLTYLGVFQEVLRHLQGNRLAVYQNTLEKQHGLFSAVAILDTPDPKLFVQTMQILARMAIADSLDMTKKEVKEELDIERLVRDLGSSVYSVRQSANTKLTLIGEPALPFLNKAIDTAKIELETKRRAQELRDRINAVAAQRRKELLDDKQKPLFASPKLTFIANVEKRQDVSVDIVQLKLGGADKAALNQYTQLLGPDWDKVRIGIVDKHIVLLLGSDVAVFEAALRNLQKGDAGLAGSKRLAGFQATAQKERLFEFHVSVEGVLRLVNPKANLDTQPQITSMALTLTDHALQVDARAPIAEVRTMAKKAQEAFR
jgi:hypothetical protein